jgi:hypothetical protein
VAFVRRFKHDVFVSYAQIDNAPDVSGSQWVSMFVTHLEQALKQRLGGADSLDIFFDRRSLHSNQQLEELLEAARSSAIFIAVASRSYAARPWTRDELDAFVKSSTTLRQLFAIECLPLDLADAYPQPLDTHKRMQFWRVNEPHSSAPMAISPTFEPGTFFPRVHDLAEQVRAQLLHLKAEPDPGGKSGAAGARPSGGIEAAVAPAEPRQPPDPNMRRVFLAQATDDMEEERDQVRRYLEQFRVPVLPEQTYPQGGGAFMQAVAADLARSDVFVQLLGPTPGRRPPDLPQGYPQAQFEAATARGIKILQWRRPDLSPDRVANADYRALLSSETVIADGLEGFKALVLGQARVPPPPKSVQSGFVFIDADRKDLDVAKQIQNEFRRHNLSTMMPALDGPADAVRADLEENLIDCDALVLVYGDTTPLWVRGQLRLFNKIKARRAAPPKILAIYTGPPEKLVDLGISLPETREINCGTSWAFEPLQSLIAELS